MRRIKSAFAIEATLRGSWLPESQWECTHWPRLWPMRIQVAHETFRLFCSPYCRSCTEQYLEKNHTVCAETNSVILPGDRVNIIHGKVTTWAAATSLIPGGVLPRTWGEGAIVDL